MYARLWGAVLLLPVTPLAAQVDAPAPADHAKQAVVAMPDALRWGPAPAILPAGAKLAVLEGDPSKPGPFTMRLAMPDGYRIAPHFHPVAEHVTVISGALQVGMGETFDATKLTTLPAGAFGLIPPGMRHFARAKGATVIQLHGTGPWRLVYVNSADQRQVTGAR